VLGLLGLGARGGNLAIGVDGVRAALQAGRCHAVVIASDAGARAHDKVVRLATARGVPRIAGPAGREIGSRLGRPPVQAVGVLDPKLAKGMLALGTGE